MEHTYLKTFYEVVKAGNVTKAAESLYVTQPAVTRRIQLLEKTYGCALLDRSEKVLKPTARGRVLFAKAAKIIEIERELDFELGQLGEEQNFSLITTPTFATVYLPYLYQDLIFHHTEIHCSKMKKIRFTQDYFPKKIMHDLQKGTFDLAVVEHCLDFPILEDLKKFDLPGDKIIFAVSKELASKEKFDELESFFKYPLYIHKEGCCSNILLEKNLKQMGYSKNNFNMIIETDDINCVMSILKNGNGVGFISSDIAKAYIDKKELCEILIPGFIHDRKRSLLVADHTLDPAITDLVLEKVKALFDKKLL